PLEPLLDAATRTLASPIVTVNLWFDRPVLEEPFIGLPGRTMQWVFDKRLVVGDTASHLSLAASGAGDIIGRSNPALVRRVLAELGAAVPAVKDAHLVYGRVVREPAVPFV